MSTTDEVSGWPYMSMVGVVGWMEMLTAMMLEEGLERTRRWMGQA